jgi:hypothetical protein
MDRTQLNLTFVSMISGLPDSVSGGVTEAQPASRNAKNMSMSRSMVSFLDLFQQAV